MSTPTLESPEPGAARPARLRPRCADLRPRHTGRCRRFHRRLRAHVGRRHRSPDSTARSHVRQPRRRGARDAGWVDRPGQAGRERRAPLGAPRRRRNFGVATWLEFRLEPLERVVGGHVVYRGKDVGEALRRYRDLVGPRREISAARQSSRSTIRGCPSSSWRPVTPARRLIPTSCNGCVRPQGWSRTKSSSTCSSSSSGSSTLHTGSTGTTGKALRP